ncbi:MAG: T9SS type A sorting domain-containing protein [candidate division Zixibacteria bacterium]|nr:T9SS type A sorting domain-containing protein [candidate division Zixibacteria bacterium]
MKRVIFASILIVITIFEISTADEELYVINGLAQTMSRIDLDNGDVDNHILTLGVVPNDIKVHRDSVYILNSISDNIQIYDLITQSEVGTIEFSRGGNPWEMVIAENGYIYVTNFVSGNVYEVDIQTSSIIREFNVGNTLEAVFESAGKLFVTDTNYDPDNYTYGTGKLYCSNLPELSEWSEIAIGTNPQKIIFGPDGNIHITCTGNYMDIEGSVYIIDPHNSSIVDVIEIGGEPTSSASANGLIFLAAGGWVDNGEVYCYDGTTYEVLNGPSNPIYTGTGSIEITSDLNNYVFSCDFYTATISKINENREVVDVYNVGDGPQNAAYYNSEWTSVDDESLPHLTDISLSVYPNPFNGSTTFTIEGILFDEVNSLNIYNIKGELAAKLNPDAIEHSDRIVWTPAGLSSGIYFLELKHKNGSTNKMLTFIK